MANISGKSGKFWYGAAATINAASGTTTITVDFASAHGLSATDKITIKDIVGMTDLNGDHTVVTVPDTDTITVLIDTTSQTYTSGGTARTIHHITSWTLNKTAEVQNVTNSGSANGAKVFIPNGFTEWNGSIEGLVEGNQNKPDFGTAITIQLDVNATEFYTGTAMINSEANTTTIGGTDAVKVSFTYQGTGVLTDPT